MGKLYDESIVSEVMSDLDTISGNVDGCLLQLQSIVNSDGYYAKSTTGVTDISNILNMNSEFSSYMSSAKSTYDEVYSDIKASVGELSEADAGNVDIIFDAIISDIELVSQIDNEWCSLTYKKDGLGNAGTIGGNGCGPCSVVNGLITTFGITGKENIKELIIECSSFDDIKNSITGYLLNSDKRDDKYPMLNSIKDNNNIVSIGSDGKQILANLGQLEDGSYYLGSMQFDDGKTYSTLLSMTEEIYKKYPDATITFYAMTGGVGNTFGSSSSGSGHYVSLLVNVREFVENGTVYLLDSDPRLLEGEEAHGKVNRKYNFTGVNSGDMGKFNSLYEVTRESENVLKVQLREGEFNANNLNYLGIRGVTQVAINPSGMSGNTNTNTIKTEVNADVEFNNKFANNTPNYTVEDTSEENSKTMAKVDANKKSTEKTANAPVTQQENTEVTEPRITAGVNENTTPTNEGNVPEVNSPTTQGTQTANNNQNTTTNTTTSNNTANSTSTEKSTGTRYTSPSDTTKASTAQETPVTKSETTEVTGFIPSYMSKPNNTSSSQSSTPVSQEGKTPTNTAHFGSDTNYMANATAVSEGFKKSTPVVHNSQPVVTTPTTNFDTSAFGVIPEETYEPVVNYETTPVDVDNIEIASSVASAFAEENIPTNNVDPTLDINNAVTNMAYQETQENVNNDKPEDSNPNNTTVRM